MICIPIVATSMDSAMIEIARACKEPADLIELRLDYLEDEVDVGALLQAARLPCIATCRPVREGGCYRGEEKKRLALLKLAAEAGAAYVDVEHDALANLTLPGNVKVIASYHNFDETPQNLAEIVKMLAALPCDIIKFVTLANKLTDNLKIWEALKACAKPAISFCMGELGEVSRVLALRQGSLLTFGSLAQGKESAPGQILARDLAELYRVKAITAKTALYAVVGNPIAHSISPEIHNAAFAALKMDAVYLRFRVDNLAEFLHDFEVLKLQGISVTIPHKDAALKASATVEPLAQKTRAVNTLTRTNSGWEGDNTDWQASLQVVQNAADRIGLSLKGANALLLGAGGAARGIACGLLEAGCKLTIANRTHSRAKELAQEFGAEVIALEEAYRGNFQVVANSTSVGMHPHEDATPVDAAVFHEGMVAFDAVYNPRRTLMLQQAEARGAAIADGVAMFVGQAARQFEIWTGRDAPLEVMEKIVVARLTRDD
ncbi:MAG: shikimate dehydrogenase [Planctomycetes bacterium]|nr:shikimate dehydrogenase [Planctomycetota bacterium]